MPRTLFGSANEEILTSVKLQCHNDNYHYRLLSGLKILRIGNFSVLVNPNNGGWVAFGESESHILRSLNNYLTNNMGRILYHIGLCSRDGEEKKFICSSEYTENLYFFEFAVTTGCNLRCGYCFADAHTVASGETATTEIAELFIDRIGEHRAKTRSRIPYIVEFTGGEPLTNFKVIRHAIEYAEDTYEDLLNVRFVLQSNLSIPLTDNILDFLIDHKVGIGISCDGFKVIQDNQRPFINGNGSHELVEKNILKLNKVYRDNSGSIITVVTQSSVNKMSEIVLYLCLFGIHEIFLRPMAELGRGTTVN